MRCQGSSTTASVPLARLWCRRTFPGLPFVRPYVLLLCRHILCEVSGPQTGTPRPQDASLLRSLLGVRFNGLYLFRGQGWIPAGDKGAHQGAQDLRGVRFVDRYIFWDRWVDSYRRQRSSTRSRGSKRDSPGSLPSAIVAATASCMERVIGIGQMRNMGGSTDQTRRAKERGTEPDGVISVLGRERFVWDVSAFHRLLGWSCASIALHLLLGWFPSGDRVGAVG